MLDWLIGLQSLIRTGMAAHLVEFADHRVWSSLAAALPAGILFGAVHALTPGHGKSVLASYLVGSGLNPLRAAGVAFILAGVHVGMGVVLALVAAPLVTRSLVGAGRAPTLENTSAILLALVGLWLLTRAVWRRPHAHAEGPVMAVAAGLVPCPLTLFTMFFAMDRGVPEAGLLFAGAMVLGVGATLVALAIATILARNTVLSLVKRHGASAARVGGFMDGISGAALLALAGFELWR